MQNANANTICVPNHVVSINANNLPFSNNFVQTEYVRTERTRNGRNAFVVVVKCTTDSREPGRLYACLYTQKGTLLGCNTLN